MDGLELNIVSVQESRPARSKKRSGRAWEKRKKRDTASSGPLANGQDSAQKTIERQVDDLIHQKDIPSVSSAAAPDQTKGEDKSKSPGLSRIAVRGHSEHDAKGVGKEQSKPTQGNVPDTASNDKPVAGTIAEINIKGRNRRNADFQDRKQVANKFEGESMLQGGDPVTEIKGPQKRKRTRAEPVSLDGVVDFTGDDERKGSGSNPRPKKVRWGKNQPGQKKGIVPATLGTPDRWWEDDDDSHAGQFVVSHARRYPPGGVEVGTEEFVDADGGLRVNAPPSRSKPTKAVDMEAESSRSMGILQSLLGSIDEGKELGGGSGTGPKKGANKVKDKGVDSEIWKKKRAYPERQVNIPLDALQEKEKKHDQNLKKQPSRPNTMPGCPEGSQGEEGNDVRAIGQEFPVQQGEGEESGREGKGAGAEMMDGVEVIEKDDAGTPVALKHTKVSSRGSPASGSGDIATMNTEVGAREEGEDNMQLAGGSPGGKEDGRSKAALAKFGSRKIPNKEGEEALSRLAKHHARPRELSRHAAAHPHPSMPSSHVFAMDGGNTGTRVKDSPSPGSGFATLGLPPQLVSRLVGMGLSGPTVCQVAAVPVLSAGHNTVIKSETGSGKTLAYLLPLLCNLSAREPRVERDQGTLAIVLAPTRELSAQILEVLTQVVRPFIWLVPGSIYGGERRKSEKARLRKGVTILVCTPGRLLDHLKTTSCFRRDRLRWLVLDEADRLLDMGFEKQVKEIVELLDQSARSVREVGGSRVSVDGAPRPSSRVIHRQLVMVSATVSKGVSRMAASLLSSHVRVDADRQTVELVNESGITQPLPDSVSTASLSTAAAAASKVAKTLSTGKEEEEEEVENVAGEKFCTPRQLVQHYTMVTQKLRLPALCCFLRQHAGEKVVVFMSTCDAVDFHRDLFAMARWPGAEEGKGGSKVMEGAGAADSSEVKGAGKGGSGGSQGQGSGNKNGGVLFGPECISVHRLHGNVPQAERQATYRAFSAAPTGVLLSTDVAARGLDLPEVDWIVQYDPPAETSDYVHRVGRTARRGRKGRSLLFLMPGESAYLGVLEGKGLTLRPLSLEGILCAADGGKRDAKCADEQLAFELQQSLQHLVAGDKGLLAKARAAFQSHVRAYAARAPDSRAVFQVRSLHLGHVARSFALKDPPTAVKVGKKIVRRPGASARTGSRAGSGGGREGGSRVEKRKRDGARGGGGGIRRLGLSKKIERFSRAEFL